MIRLLYQIPDCLQRLYGGVAWRLGTDRSVYLTFDDGPIPEVTPRILQILKEKGVKATFFVVGDNVRKHPELLQAILADGHSVGNHTFHHIPGLQTPTSHYLKDVHDTEDILQRSTSLFRPPYGRMRFSQKRELLRQGFRIVLWDVLTHDYNPRYSQEKMLLIIRRYTRPGSIVVFHDSLRSNERMLSALPQAIDFWLSQGYTLRTL